jgi:tRNA G18 (ribose-2'-O)-methylase SpoU
MEHEPLLVGGQGLKYNVHNFAQTFNKEKSKDLSKKLSINAEVAILNTKFSMNAAMIARTIAVMGFQRLHIIGPKACDMRSAVGSQHYIDIVKPGEINPSTYFDEMGLFPILVEQGGESLEEFNFKPFIREGKNICFVMGNESTGLSDDYLKQGFPIVSISQYGLVRSLNVQTAAAIVIYEFTKQWRQVQMNKL